MRHVKFAGTVRLYLAKDRGRMEKCERGPCPGMGVDRLATVMKKGRSVTSMDIKGYPTKPHLCVHKHSVDDVRNNTDRLISVSLLGAQARVQNRTCDKVHK